MPSYFAYDEMDDDVDLSAGPEPKYAVNTPQPSNHGPFKGAADLIKNVNFTIRTLISAPNDKDVELITSLRGADNHQDSTMTGLESHECALIKMQVFYTRYTRIVEQLNEATTEDAKVHALMQMDSTTQFIQDYLQIAQLVLQSGEATGLVFKQLCSRVDKVYTALALAATEAAQSPQHVYSALQTAPWLDVQTAVKVKTSTGREGTTKTFSALATLAEVEEYVGASVNKGSVQEAQDAAALREYLVTMETLEEQLLQPVESSKSIDALASARRAALWTSVGAATALAKYKKASSQALPEAFADLDTSKVLAKEYTTHLQRAQQHLLLKVENLLEHTSSLSEACKAQKQIEVLLTLLTPGKSSAANKVADARVEYIAKVKSIMTMSAFKEWIALPIEAGDIEYGAQHLGKDEFAASEIFFVASNEAHEHGFIDAHQVMRYWSDRDNLVQSRSIILYPIMDMLQLLDSGKLLTRDQLYTMDTGLNGFAPLSNAEALATIATERRLYKQLYDEMDHVITVLEHLNLSPGPMVDLQRTRSLLNPNKEYNAIFHAETEAQAIQCINKLKSIDTSLVAGKLAHRKLEQLSQDSSLSQGLLKAASQAAADKHRMLLHV